MKLKRVVVVPAALAAAGIVLIALSLPPARVALADEHDGTVSGIIHIHTNRSDGRSSPDEVAAAAARAGLTFIAFTDHGDATRTPDPPMYRAGVLCLDGVEISTAGGHYVAIGLPEAPYPLGGEPRDVVEDVARLGGFGVAAHPDSPKRDLEWRGWSAPFDGLEILNPDTSWRVHATQPGLRPKLRLLEAIATYVVRPPETIAGLFGHSAGLLARWDALTHTRRVVGVGGADAHAQIGGLPMPSYDASFRALSVHVKTARALSGDAVADAAAILDGLRAGHVYTAVNGFATPPSFQFSATTNEAGNAGPFDQGDELVAAGPVTLRVTSNAPGAFTTTVWRGSEMLETGHHERTFAVVAPEGEGVYRVEIRATDRRDQPLWIVSNPIYVRAAGHLQAPGGELRHAPAVETRPLFDGHDAAAWRVEEGRSSRGTLSVEQGELKTRYLLPPGVSSESYIAPLVSFPQYLAAYDRVTFVAHADRPMRVSVQVRSGRPGSTPERWQRSVYLDTVGRPHTIYFDDLTPIGAVPGRTPSLIDMTYVLFVVDTTNTKPGASGEFWISDVALQK